MVSDKVCISNSSDCVDNFKFYAISSQTGLDSEDGILGLSPDELGNGPSYVAALKQQNLIDQKMVSFFLSQDKMSQFTFGGYS